MKKRYFFLLLPAFVFGNSLLNDLKQKELNYDRKYSVEDSKDTEKSWINPLMLQYSYTKDDTLGDIKTTNRVFSVSVNQPVFKSGAIYYSIKYALHSKSYNLLNINLKKRELIKTALDLAYDYKITQLNKQIVQLNIKNAKIDIQKKKEDFLNGVGDSTLLNNAVLKLNDLKLNMEDLNTKLKTLKYSFEKISSLNIENVKLPVFKMISKKDFINSNLELISQKKLKKIKYDLYKMQLGNQLLSVNLNGSLNWQKTDYSENTPLLNDSKNDYYRVGFTVTLPLSFNSVNKVAKNKIDYLKSETLIEDKKRELITDYENITAQIKAIDDKIKIYEENIKIYDDLINSCIDSIKAGNATTLDLQILENSRKTGFINIKVLKLQQQKLLLSLYYELSEWNFK